MGFIRRLLRRNVPRVDWWHTQLYRKNLSKALIGGVNHSPASWAARSTTKLSLLQVSPFLPGLPLFLTLD